VNDWLGIVELHGISTELRDRNAQLFEELGGWVTVTSPGELQRLFADACHRHAWHAELWSRRTPAIPGPPVSPVAAHGDETPAVERDDRAKATAYRSALTDLEAGMEGIRRRVDAALDPATTRTVQLVMTDVAELRNRLDRISSG
jgi:hypothetical protein